MIFLIIALGLIVGTMLNFFIYRIPRSIKLYKKLPTCYKCERKKRWYEYLPIIGFFFCYRCPNCHETKRLRDLFVPIVNTLLWIIVYLVFRDSMYFVYIMLPLVSTLIVVSMIDYEFYIIPDRMHIIILALGILTACFEEFIYPSVLGIDIISRVIGFFAGGLLLFITGFFVSKKLNKEALGGGDIKLMAVLGFFIGWRLILMSIFFGSISGMIGMLFTKRRSEEGGIAFGPFLIVGTILAIFIGNVVFNWYVGLFN